MGSDTEYIHWSQVTDWKQTYMEGKPIMPDIGELYYKTDWSNKNGY